MKNKIKFILSIIVLVLICPPKRWEREIEKLKEKYLKP